MKQQLFTNLLPSSSNIQTTQRRRGILRKFVAAYKNRGDHRQRGGFEDSKGRQEVNERHDALEQKNKVSCDTQTHNRVNQVQCLGGKVFWSNTKLLSQTELSDKSSKTSAAKALTTGSPERNCWGQQHRNNPPLYLCVCVRCVLLHEDDSTVKGY